MAKRYQRGNQNPYIEEEQTTQWPKDTKGVIRIRITKKNETKDSTFNILFTQDTTHIIVLQEAIE
jgi:predicted YcjX-like family ATPase